MLYHHKQVGSKGGNLFLCTDLVSYFVEPSRKFESRSYEDNIVDIIGKVERANSWIVSSAGQDFFLVYKEQEFCA